jgi:hypothetical protein
MEYFIKLVKRKYKKDVSTDARALQVGWRALLGGWVRGRCGWVGGAAGWRC